MNTNTMKYPCRGCAYFSACGDEDRTEFCAGRKVETGMEEKIKEDLDYAMKGAHMSYSMFYVFGATREEVESAIIELSNQNCFANEVNGCSNYTEGVFAFIGWKESPDTAQKLSLLLQNKLVIAETSWDYFDIRIYLNGKVAEKEKDYLMSLEYEPYDSEDNTLEYVDTEYVFADLHTKKTIRSGAGMVYIDDFENVKTIATSVLGK